MSYEDAADLQADRLDAYRLVALYARGYRQAVDAEDSAWESGMAIELDAALSRVRRIEARVQVEVGL